MPAPLPFDLWPQSAPQFSPLLMIAQPPQTVEEDQPTGGNNRDQPTGGSAEGLTHSSWEAAGGEGVAQEYYGSPILEQNPEEESTESGEIGWETRGEFFLSTGAGVEGRSYSEETIWQNEEKTEEKLDGEEQGSQRFATEHRDHRSGEISRSFEHQQTTDINSTPATRVKEPPYKTDSNRDQSVSSSELPFLAGNPSSPSPPPQHLPLPRPASSATPNDPTSSDNLDASPALTLEESQRRYYAPLSDPSCMCPCTCAPTTTQPIRLFVCFICLFVCLFVC